VRGLLVQEGTEDLEELGARQLVGQDGEGFPFGIRIPSRCGCSKPLAPRTVAIREPGTIDSLDEAMSRSLNGSPLVPESPGVLAAPFRSKLSERSASGRVHDLGGHQHPQVPSWSCPNR
jgi:hypothetical protein